MGNSQEGSASQGAIALHQKSNPHKTSNWSYHMSEHVLVSAAEWIQDRHGKQHRADVPVGAKHGDIVYAGLLEKHQ